MGHCMTCGYFDKGEMFREMGNKVITLLAKLNLKSAKVVT